MGLRAITIRLGNLGVAALLTGCASYEARPLDLPAFREAWAARAADTPGVRALAAGLGAESGHAGEFDPSDGLTVREAEAVALFYNPDLRVARLRAGVTAATLEHAGLWNDPTLFIDAKRLLEGVGEPWKLFGGIGLTLPVSGRLEAETARAGAGHAAELARIAREEWSVRAALCSAWTDWSASVARARAAHVYLEGLDSIVGIVDALHGAGELSSSQTRPFHVERALRRADLRVMEGDAAAGEAEVRAIMGLTGAAPLALTPSIRTWEAGDRANAITERSPDLLVAAAEYATAERTLALEVRRQYPDITLMPGLGNDRGDDEIGLGVSLPLPIWNGNRQAIAEAEAQRESARGAYESEFERLSGRLESARARLDSARALRATLESEVSALVDAQYDEARRIAELGEVDTFLLLDTLRTRHDTTLRIIDALAAESRAEAGVRALLGPPGRVEGALPTGAGRSP